MNQTTGNMWNQYIPALKTLTADLRAAGRVTRRVGVKNDQVSNPRIAVSRAKKTSPKARLMH
jgi:hypothetical protein